MTIRPFFARVLLPAGIAFFGMLTPAPAVMAACSDPAAPGVDWSGCDLTNRDLFDANLIGANLSGANLSGVIWVDGTFCAEGSVGQCIPAPTMSGMGGLAYSN